MPYKHDCGPLTIFEQHHKETRPQKPSKRIEKLEEISF